jgi:hypothetical protein
LFDAATIRRRDHHRRKSDVMQHADHLLVLHHNDTRTEYTDVHYTLDRHGVRIRTADAEVVHTEVLNVQAYRQRRSAAAA